MTKTIIGVISNNGPLTPYSDLHEGERTTVDAILALHEQSRTWSAVTPVGVIVFASIGDGPMSQFRAFATKKSTNPIKAALEAARNAGESSKTTLAISVSGSPADADIADDANIESFIEQGGRTVLFIGSDQSVVVTSYEPVYE
jgi:hypothetical protein